MPRSLRFARALLLAISLVFAFAGSYAAVPPATIDFHSFIGSWHGVGRLIRLNQRQVGLRIIAHCRKVAAGWAVSCHMNAESRHSGKGHVSLSEADLMGVNSATETAHWYAVDNMGEAHDHVVWWPNDRTMVARHAWIEGGMRMREIVTFRFADKHDMAFQSLLTANGRRIELFSGSLRRDGHRWLDGKHDRPSGPALSN